MTPCGDDWIAGLCILLLVEWVLRWSNGFDLICPHIAAPALKGIGATCDFSHLLYEFDIFMPALHMVGNERLLLKRKMVSNVFISML